MLGLWLCPSEECTQLLKTRIAILSKERSPWFTQCGCISLAQIGGLARKLVRSSGLCHYAALVKGRFKFYILNRKRVRGGGPHTRFLAFGSGSLRSPNRPSCWSKVKRGFLPGGAGEFPVGAGIGVCFLPSRGTSGAASGWKSSLRTTRNLSGWVRTLEFGPAWPGSYANPKMGSL